MEQPGTSAMTGPRSEATLLCKVGAHLCALRLATVKFTLRPLAIEALGESPGCVLGLSVIRGVPVPVIDARRLLGLVSAHAPSRYVVLAVDARCVALAVDAVVGVRDLPGHLLEQLPPLLRDAATDMVEAIGTLDGALLLVLDEARLVPESVWRSLGSAEANA